MNKTSPPKLFASSRLDAIERRAIAMTGTGADFLHREAAATIADRLDATNREFPVAADFLSPFECMTEMLSSSEKVSRVFRITMPGTMQKSGAKDEDVHPESRELLPLQRNSVHLVTSVFSLHRINDLPGMLSQIRHCLVEDGLLMACLPGERTLSELRASLVEAESILTGAASLRIDPFVEVRQAGNLLQRAGFALPVVDSDLLTVRYGSLKGLVKDLRAMGANSAFSEPPAFGSRELFRLAEEIYRDNHSDPDGRLRASVEIIYLSGWKPHSSQQQPLEPGSAKKHLRDVL